MPTERRDRPGRVGFLDLHYDLLDADGVLAALSAVGPHSPYHYVVTPNVDHVVRLADPQDTSGDRGEVRAAYEDAAYCLCDSRVLALLARSCGVRLPVVPGSELTAGLFERVIAAGDVVAVVGGDEELLQRLRTQSPGVEFKHHRPPMGLRSNPAAMREAAAFVARSGARFALLAVGSPQQELLARAVASHPEARGCALCIGAGVEFVSGQRRRAPRVLQRLHLEWAYRLAQDPRRLWRRYLVDGPRIFTLVRRWRRAL